MKRVLFFTAIAFLLPSIAAAEWVFQLSTGSALNIPTPLEIKQDGRPDIDITAEYDTKAFSTQAYYYNIKLAKWKDGRAWEFETLHHKLFLSNRPDEVQRFNISHGYNLNTVNRAWLVKGLIYRVGLGVVMTHPETTVRGKEHENEGGVNGFYISGLTAQGAVEKRFDISRKFFLSLEGKLTASYADIPVAGGEASVPNVAAHGLFGFGYRH
jgi:hypothetical protein